MRRLLLGAACAAAFAGHVAPGEASCLATAKWHGHQYNGWGRPDVPRGAKLNETAKIPGCNDVITNGKPANEPTRALTAHRIQGVAPTVALRVGRSVYVNSATFPSLASHPLHAALYRKGTPERPTKPCTITGTAEPGPGGFRLVYGRKRTGWLSTTPGADVQPQRYGTGYIPHGTRITVTGICEPSTYYTLIVADRIIRA